MLLINMYEGLNELKNKRKAYSWGIMMLPIRFWACRPLVIAERPIAHNALSITGPITPSMCFVKIMSHSKIMTKLMCQNLEAIWNIKKFLSYLALYYIWKFVVSSIKSYCVYIQNPLRIEYSNIHSDWCCMGYRALLRMLHQHLRRHPSYTTRTSHLHRLD